MVDKQAQGARQSDFKNTARIQKCVSQSKSKVQDMGFDKLARQKFDSTKGVRCNRKVHWM